MDAEALSAATQAVALEGVDKRFSPHGAGEIIALSEVSLSVAHGSVVALAGPSGSGKSTLLYIIGALERADRGRVVVDGRDLGTLRGRPLAEHRRRVGFVFQRFNLLPALTVLDNVMAPAVPYRTTFDKATRARELIAVVGLEGRERSLPSQLSGGQQQRVAIARALFSQPALVLADEPTGNLDSQTGREIIDLLLALRVDHGVTVIMATHDPEIATRSDRVVRLLDGRITHDLAVSGAREVTALLGGSILPE